MPIIKSAKKQVRVAKRNYAQNLKYKKAYKKAMADYYKEPSEKKLSLAFSKIDKAVKINLIHKNKAGRLKSAMVKNPKKKISKKRRTTKKIKRTKKK